MRGTINKGFVVLALSSLGVAFAADPIELDLTPVYGNSVRWDAVQPVRVDISNVGPAAKGMLRVSGGDDFAMYPVDLPSGSRQRFFTYCRSDYGGQHYVLSTDRGMLIRDIPQQAEPASSSSTVAIIGEAPGAVAGIRSRNASRNGTAWSDSYVRIAFAPDRAVGYKGIDTVVLGKGSEALGDDRVRALQEYVLSGGTLVFVGGSSFPTLVDPRWRPLLPATDFHRSSVAGSPKLNAFAGETLNGEVPLAVGQPVAGATVVRENKTPIAYERPWGLGHVFVYTFSPFEEPLDHSSAVGSILTQTVHQTQGTDTGSLAQTFGLADRAGPTTTVQQDPFSMTLPSTETILSVLIGYFVVVVPINFLILRKVKRGEFAWFTAPLLSLVFAGILFKSAQSLYSAKLSTATQGVLVGQVGSPEAMFVGSSQMFIPSGGFYDLGLRGVDSLSVVAIPSSITGAASHVSNAFELQPMDVGEIQVPHMRADNLTFREMSYRQRFDSRDWFSIRRTGKGKIEITNHSPCKLEKAALVHGYIREEIGDLGKGQSKTIPFRPDSGDRGLYSTGDVRNITGPADRVALTGVVKDLRPGPQIGKVIEDRTQIVLAYFADGSMK